jgi:predicted Zn-dependent protease
MSSRGSSSWGARRWFWPGKLVAVAQLALLALLLETTTWPFAEGSARPAAAAQQPTSTLPVIRGEIYIVPLGDVPQRRILTVQSYVQRKLGLSVRSEAPLPIDRNTLSPEGDKLIFEDVVDQVQRSYNRLAGNRRVMLLVLTAHDVRLRDRAAGSWVFSSGMGRVGMVSTARLDNAFWGLPADEAWLEERMQKLVMRNIGFIYYGLGASDDPRNVLSRSVDGMLALDEMTDELDPVKVAVATPGRAFPTVSPIGSPIAEASRDEDEDDAPAVDGRMITIVAVGFIAVTVVGLIVVAIIELWERAER